jgi:uncharacterized protein
MNVSPFSKSDEAVLRKFLSSPLRPEGTMTYVAFRGYLFGLSSGPTVVPPSVWMPGVFGDENARYADLEDARAVVGSVMSAYNHTNAMISGKLDLTPDAVGIHLESESELVEWSMGFTLGYQLVRESWARALDGREKEVRGEFTATALTLLIWADRDKYLDDVDPLHRETFLEECRQAIPSALARHAALGLRLFREALAQGRASIRRAPKVGRNDPCPCGSGKKFKKCCLN